MNSPRSQFRVYFACVGNSARSIMAEAIARFHGGPYVLVASGGSTPLGTVLPETLQVLRARGIPASGLRSKPLDNDFAKGADLIVTMGCGDDACPTFIGKPIQDWGIPDPKGQGVPAFQAARDEIETRVLALLRSRGIPAPKATTP